MEVAVFVIKGFSLKCSKCGAVYSAIGDCPLEAGVRSPWSHLRNGLLMFVFAVSAVFIRTVGSFSSSLSLLLACVAGISGLMAIGFVLMARLNQDLCQRGHYVKGGTCPSCGQSNKVRIWSA